MPVTTLTTSTVEISLGAAPVTELEVTAKATYWTLSAGRRIACRGYQARVRTNGTTPVVVIPAPPDLDHEYELTDFYMVQVNAADTEIILKCNFGGDRYLMLDHTLSQGDNLRFA